MKCVLTRALIFNLFISMLLYILIVESCALEVSLPMQGILLPDFLGVRHFVSFGSVDELSILIN